MVLVGLARYVCSSRLCFRDRPIHFLGSPAVGDETGHPALGVNRNGRPLPFVAATVQDLPTTSQHEVHPVGCQAIWTATIQNAWLTLKPGLQSSCSSTRLRDTCINTQEDSSHELRKDGEKAHTHVYRPFTHRRHQLLTDGALALCQADRPLHPSLSRLHPPIPWQPPPPY